MNQFNQRISGILGMMGGIVLFAGDMLFYYAPESTDLTHNMAHAADWRIMVSGVSALLAAWLYMLGLGQVYYAFQPTIPMVRNIVLFCFGSIFIAYGVIHGAYVAIATTAKVAAQHQINIKESTKLAFHTNNQIRLIVYPVFTILSFVFINRVWHRKTLYPRWVIIFFPSLLFLIKDFVGEMLTGKLWIIIIGGYFNIICILFFLASTIALWNKKPVLTSNSGD